ncbi:hypothetical protein AYI68_g6780 [Smittium mucronatum]|uniref:Uncharacterized protein n=1 Tax=Smittium mucronatum TaxID=133383 RepID=A0A1R0GQJ2_9FUNG|nr:hypothetical protein AYI68_g6780 [Smittium mucronatum]
MPNFFEDNLRYLNKLSDSKKYQINCCRGARGGHGSHHHHRHGCAGHCCRHRHHCAACCHGHRHRCIKACGTNLHQRRVVYRTSPAPMISPVIILPRIRRHVIRPHLRRLKCPRARRYIVRPCIRRVHGPRIHRLRLCRRRIRRPSRCVNTVYGSVCSPLVLPLSPPRLKIRRHHCKRRRCRKRFCNRIRNRNILSQKVELGEVKLGGNDSVGKNIEGGGENSVDLDKKNTSNKTADSERSQKSEEPIEPIKTISSSASYSYGSENDYAKNLENVLKNEGLDSDNGNSSIDLTQTISDNQTMTQIQYQTFFQTEYETQESTKFTTETQS